METRKARKRKESLLDQEILKILKDPTILYWSRLKHYVRVDASLNCFHRFGFNAFERVSTKSGPGTVIGKDWNDPYCWIHLDRDDGASYWDNGVNYRTLVEYCEWKRLEDQTIPKDHLDKILKGLCDTLELKDLPIFELEVTEHVEQDVDQIILKYFKCPNCLAPKLNHKCELDPYQNQSIDECKNVINKIDKIDIDKSESTNDDESNNKDVYEKISLKQAICPICLVSMTETLLSKHSSTCENYSQQTDKEKAIVVSIQVPDVKHNGEQMEILNRSTKKDTLKLKCIDTLIKFINSKFATSIDVANLLMSIFKLDSLLKFNCVYFFVKISNIIMNDGFLMLNEELKELVMLEWLRNRTSIILNDLLEILEFLLEEDMENIVKIVNKTITLKPNNIVAAYKITTKRVDLPLSRDFCVKIMGNMDMEKLHNLDEFASLPDWLRKNLMDEINEQWENNAKRKKEDDEKFMMELEVDDMSYEEEEYCSDNDNDEVEEEEEVQSDSDDSTDMN